MEPLRVVAVCLSLAASSQAGGRGVVTRSLHVTLNSNGTQAASMIGINPPLHDVSSDKKFFGPPFPADYPDDKRPVIQKSILDKLKGPEQPYPALQSKADYDRDFVKDENSDKGAWKAQFEYDALRKKLAGEEADEKRAGDRASKEGRDVDDAQRKVDQAGRDVDGARKDADDARKAGEDGGDGGADAAPPSTDSLDEMKKRVAEAEAKYAKEQKEFEECKKQLEQAKANLEEAKAQYAALEKKLAAETKLWAEQKTVRLNAAESRRKAAETKRKVADERLAAARKSKADVDETLARKVADHEQAKRKLDKEHAEVEQAKNDLAKATLTLQKLRGYKPAPMEPLKSAALTTTAGAAVLCLVSFRI